MNPFFSIILPIYNVELYIKEALLSLVNQDLPLEEYEVILVDDGSKDNSVAIANELLPQLPNAYWIHQENKGLSEARNAGVKKASGEYIWFVDSDDYIAPNSLSVLKKQLLEEGMPDMLALSGVEFWEQSAHRKPSMQYAENQISRSGVGHLADISLFIAVHHYLFRHSFLEHYHLSFYPKIMHEDEEYLPRALYWASKVVYSSLPVYFYRRRPGSITTVYNPQRGKDLFLVAESLYSFYEQNRDPGLLARVNRAVLSALALYKENRDKKGAQEYFEKMIQNSVLQRFLKETNNKRVRLFFRTAKRFSFTFTWYLFLLKGKLTTVRQ